jgi:tRNA threonylcarbamoyladenosine biosynthesis protein TsaE
MKSTSLTQTEQIANDFVATLTPRTTATIVALHGDLGAGKTTFTQAVARTLGVTDTVTSPTFVIEKIYKLTHQHFSHLIHIDAYRLESGKELETLGWKEISEDPKNLIFIEWPEKVEDILPSTMKHIYFSHVDESTREIVI